MKRKKDILTFRSRDLNPRFSVIFPPMIWIFMESEEGEIKSKQASKKDRTSTQKILTGIWILKALRNTNVNLAAIKQTKSVDWQIMKISCTKKNHWIVNIVISCATLGQSMENTIENFTRITKKLSKSMPSKETSDTYLDLWILCQHTKWKTCHSKPMSFQI